MKLDSLNEASVCIFFTCENIRHRFHDDADVKQQRPVLYVFYVLLHAIFHLTQFLCLTTESRHLGKAGDARFCQVANHVAVDDVGIFLCVLQHVRTGTHNRHVAQQHVDELWELVNVGFAHDIAVGEFAWVVFGGLKPVGVFVHVHRPELQAIKRLAV